MTSRHSGAAGRFGDQELGGPRMTHARQQCACHSRGEQPVKTQTFIKPCRYERRCLVCGRRARGADPV